jgi:epoxyqueuosine reductase
MTTITKNVLKEKALQRGFNRFRVTSVTSGLGIEHYDKYLSKGHHGSMGWMVRSRPPRADVRKLLPTAKSMIVLGLDYRHPIPVRPEGMYGRVSCYAWGRDYHNLIGKRLRSLSKELRLMDPTLEMYWGVDSRPFIERAWAQKAGLGYLGKNCMIISPADSSYFFLAMILINKELQPDQPIIRDHCGKCSRCIDICPTNAFIDSYQLDSRRCISYLTIEHPTDIPQVYRDKIGDWVFGCDLCQEVCPHNHKMLLSKHSDLAPRPQHAWIDLRWLLTAPDDEINDRFIGTPLRRSGPERLRRNAAVVLGNYKTNEAFELAKCAWKNSSPMVKRHLEWAF